MTLLEELNKLYPKVKWISESYRGSTIEQAITNLSLKYNIYNNPDNIVTLKIIKKSDTEYAAEVKFWFTNFFVVRTKVYDTTGSTLKEVVENCLDGLKCFANGLMDIVINFKLGE